jgi:predicted O-methyltransferase YrrM
MDAAPYLIDGAGSRDQRLASDLPTKHSLTIFVRAAAPKDIDFDLLNVKQCYEVVERLLCRSHPSMLAELSSVAFALTNMLDFALRTIALTTKGFMPEAEGDALFVAARSACEALPGLPMVEVGSYCGRSTVWLGAVARECGTVLHAVDHHGGSEENQAGWEWHDPEIVNTQGRIDTLPFFRQTMQRAGLVDVVRECVGDSHAIGAAWREPLALCFVDGGHARAVARGDYEAWAQHVAVGGLLAIHDVFEDSADGGQAPFEEIYLPALHSGKFTERSRSGSLRVLQRTSR